MAKKTNYYYVAICDNFKFKFVTDIDNETRTAKWSTEKGAKPYEMGSYIYAQRVAMGLQLNGFWAFPVHLWYNLETQPYYSKEDEK